MKADYADRIREAEKTLGSLTEGQKVDLLLDNFPELIGCDEAREIVKSLQKEAR